MPPLFKVVFSLSASEFFLRAGRFLFFMLLANRLSASLFGEYIYVVSLFTLLYVISDFGIAKILTKSLAKEEDFDYRSLVFLRLLFFVMLSILLFVFLHQQLLLSIAVALLFFLDALAEMSYAIYRAKEQFHRETVIKLWLFMAYLTVSFWLYFYKNNSIYGVLLLIALLYFLILLPHLRRLRFFKFSFPSHLMLHQEGLMLVLASIFTIAYLRIDILMIEYFMDTQGVASYAVGAKVLELAMILPMAISSVLLPRMVRSIQHRQPSLWLHFAIGVLVASLFFFFYPYIIRLLFASYADAVVLIQILSFGLPFLMLNNYVFTAFIARGRANYYLYTTALMLAANALLNAVYIPLYGVEAAAYTTILTEFLGALAALYGFRQLGRQTQHTKP